MLVTPGTDLSAHESARDEAVRSLRVFAEKRLLEEAGDNLQPEKVELAANPAVELARRIDQGLASVTADEEAWKRVQSGIQQQFSELNDQLGMRGYRKSSHRRSRDRTSRAHPRRRGLGARRQ